MIIVDCPWCDAPVALDRLHVVRCEGCSVEVELAPDVAADLALAA